jgi:hypothetical protein
LIPLVMSSVAPPDVQRQTCSAPACGLTAVLQWQRWASEAEYAAVPATHQIGAATIAVFACASHALSAEASVFVHQAACAWPAACSCKADPTEQIE